MRIKDINTIHHDRRTLRDTFNDEAVWVKYAVVAKRTLFRMACHGLAQASRQPIFRSTHNPNGTDALRAEATRLREMKNKGYLVPKIYEQQKDHLVLSDIGTCLADAIAISDTDERRRLFVKAVSHLGTVHKKGDYHGRALTKDMTVLNDNIGMIDMEHEPLKIMPLADAQGRDFWFMCYDAAKYHKDDPELLPGMLDAYAGQAPRESLYSFQKAVAFMAPLSSKIGAAALIAGNNNHVRNVANMNCTLSALMQS